MTATTIRAKFACVSITDRGPHVPKEVKFTARYDMSVPEDRRFQKATPWGEFSMHVDNPVAVDQCEIGAEYYFDMTKVSKEPPLAA